MIPLAHSARSFKFHRDLGRNKTDPIKSQIQRLPIRANRTVSSSKRKRAAGTGMVLLMDIVITKAGFQSPHSSIVGAMAISRSRISDTI